MPTEPHDGLLDRDFVLVTLRPVIDRSRPLLQELVNYGTMLLARCDYCATGPTDVNVSTLSLFQSALQQLDGIEALSSNVCADACIPPLRTLYEHLLGIDYILQDPDKFEQRSFAWYVFRIQEKLNYLDLLDDQTTLGQQFKSEIELDDVAQNAELSVSPEALATERARYESSLALPHLQAHRDHLREGRLSRGGRIVQYRHWYELYGGPTSLYGLAKDLNRAGMYRLLYSVWSKKVHGAGDLAYRLTRGDVTFRPIRDPATLRDTVTFATVFAVDMVRLLIAKYRPGEDWRPWFLREIKPLLDSLQPAV